jgi:hypothetical protein
MAGKEIGEFSTKFTSLTLSPGPAGSVLSLPPQPAKG